MANGHSHATLKEAKEEVEDLKRRGIVARIHPYGRGRFGRAVEYVVSYIGQEKEYKDTVEGTKNIATQIEKEEQQQIELSRKRTPEEEAAKEIKKMQDKELAKHIIEAEPTSEIYQERKLETARQELVKLQNQKKSKGEPPGIIEEIRDPKTLRVINYKLTENIPDIEKFLSAKQESLKKQQEERKRRGITDLGTIEAIRNPETMEIINYELTFLDRRQKRKEQTERDIRKIGSNIQTEFKTATKQKQLGRETGQTFATMSGNIGNVKAGINRSGLQTIGKGGQPKESIASLPRQNAGNIGSVGNPPAIAQSNLRPPEYVKPQQARAGFEVNVGNKLGGMPKIAEGNEISKVPSILTEGMTGQGARLRLIPSVPRLVP